MSKENEVLEALKVIIDPDLGRDIVSLGFIKDLHIDGGNVSFVVELTTPACPVKDRFQTECERVVSALPWVENVTVLMSAQKTKSPLQAQSPGLSRVANIVAVSSCKGGVGKSTMAVNLAYTLAKTGAKVGIFDADVYGPSLPTLVHPDTDEVYQQNGLIVPLEAHGVKLMSFGFVTPRGGEGAAIMRGPMVTQVINQLLTGTDWGELDYLVLDLPPGTGDVQLTLTQLVPITAAIIVTTPQHLSFIDVVKGIQMFDKVKVPTVAVIENMSYFQPEPDGEKYKLFGEGARKKLIEQYGFQNTFEFPVVPRVAEMCDNGTPVVLEDPDSDTARTFGEIGGMVVREISKLKHGAVEKPQVSFTAGRGIILTLADGTEYELDPVDVRMACRGAHTVDELTGEQKIKREDIPKNIHPTAIGKVGNYAVSIQWSWGNVPSIYPYEALLALAGE